MEYGHLRVGPSRAVGPLARQHPVDIGTDHCTEMSRRAMLLKKSRYHPCDPTSPILTMDPLTAGENIACLIYVHLFVTVPCLEHDRQGEHSLSDTVKNI